MATFLFAFILFFIPIKIGVGNNENIPIIGSIEKISEEQVDGTLFRAGTAYATLKAIQITPKMFENVELPFISLKLGALLSPIVEQLDMLDSVLFYALLVAFGEKFLLGWITYMSLHWLIPLGLLFYSLSKIEAIQKRFEAIGKIGGFFIQFGLLAYLLLPTTALVNQSIYSAFNVDEKISSAQRQQQEISKYQDGIEKAKREMENASDIASQQEISAEEEEEFLREITAPKKGMLDSVVDSAKDMWNGTKDVASSVVEGTKKIVGDTFDTIKNPKETIKKMCDALNDMLNHFMEMVAVFVITTIVVPIGIFFGFIAIFKQIYTPSTKEITTNLAREIQRTSNKAKEIGKKLQEQTKES